MVHSLSDIIKMVYDNIDDTNNYVNNLIDILKKHGYTVESFIREKHKSNPNGTYNTSTTELEGYTFKTQGHPAQSISLYAKEGADSNEPIVDGKVWTYIDGF